MTEEIDVSALVKKAQAIGNVLERRGVFGNASTYATAKDQKNIQLWIAHEKAHFVSEVVRQALDPMAQNPRILRYADSLAMVTLDTQVTDGVASLSFLTAELRPNTAQESPIDFDAVNAEVQEMLES